MEREIYYQEIVNQVNVHFLEIFYFIVLINIFLHVVQKNLCLKINLNSLKITMNYPKWW